MKLEMKKFHLGRYVRSALIASFIIFGFMMLLAYVQDSDQELLKHIDRDFVQVLEEQMFPDHMTVFSVIDTFVRGVFIVFASVMLVRFVINEYKSKSITVLFMYPIHRKKIIAAKLLLIMLFIFSCIILANILISILFYVANYFFPIVGKPLTIDVVQKSLIKVVMNAFTASCMSLIPLYFGMRKYSGSATIITSLLVVAIVCNNTNGFSLNDIIIIPISLALVGLTIAYLSIHRVNLIDVL